MIWGYHYFWKQPFLRPHSPFFGAKRKGIIPIKMQLKGIIPSCAWCSLIDIVFEIHRIQSRLRNILPPTASYRLPTIPHLFLHHGWPEGYVDPGFFPALASLETEHPFPPWWKIATSRDLSLKNPTGRYRRLCLILVPLKKFQIHQ